MDMSFPFNSSAITTLFPVQASVVRCTWSLQTHAWVASRPV